MKIERINSWFEKLAEKIIRKRWIIIGSFIALMAFSFLGLKKVIIESAYDGYFLEDDPMLVQSDKFKEIFGNDYYVAVLTESDNTFSKQSLELIRELSNELMDSISYAEKITSLTDIEYMKGTEEGMQIEQIVPEIIPSDKASLDSIKQKAYSKPNIAKKLVSNDGRLSWILLKLRAFPEDSVWRKESSKSPDYITGEETDRIINKEKYKPINPRATGMPYLTYRKQLYFGGESGRVMGLALLMAIVVLALFTRSFRGVLIPLITSVSAIVVVYGLTGYVGYPIDSGMTSVPVLLSFAIGIAYNIYVYTCFKKQLYFHGNRKNAIIESIKENGWPLLFAAFTTIASLLTFLFIPMKPLRFVGVGSSLSVLFTFIIVILLAPALLSFGKDKTPHPEVEKAGGRWFDIQLGKLGIWTLSHSKTIFTVFVLLFAFFIYEMGKVEPAFDIDKTMGRKVPYVNSLMQVCESELGSLYSYDVMVEFPQNDMAKNPENLKKLDQYAMYVESLPLTKRTSSINDILKDLNQTLNANKPDLYTIPDDANQVAQMLLLYENAGGSEAQYWIDYDYRRLRLMVELKTYNSSEAEKELTAIQVKARSLFPDAKVTAVGNLPQFTTMMQYVVRGQVQSLITAILIIGIMLMLVFSSFKIGLIALVPNVAPAFSVGCVMGMLGIPLDMMTATIIPMILGMAVDDTIHFINHVHLEFNKSTNYSLAVSHTLRKIGIAIIMATVILSVNFAIYSSSSAKQFLNLGMLTVIGLVSAVISEILITPILIKWFKIFGKENNNENNEI